MGSGADKKPGKRLSQVEGIVVRLRSFIKKERLKLNEEMEWAGTMEDIKRMEYFNGQSDGLLEVESWLKKEGV